MKDFGFLISLIVSIFLKGDKFLEKTMEICVKAISVENIFIFSQCCLGLIELRRHFKKDIGRSSGRRFQQSSITLRSSGEQFSGIFGVKF